MTSPPADRLYLGWQYATPHPPPGPPPRRPLPPEHERLDPDWAAAQRREENLLNRPVQAAFALALAIVVVATALALISMMFLLMVRVSDPLVPRAIFGPRSCISTAQLR